VFIYVFPGLHLIKLSVFSILPFQVIHESRNKQPEYTNSEHLCKSSVCLRLSI